MNLNISDQTYRKIAAALLVFFLYVGLFQINGGHFAELFFGTATPIFLPAFVRLFGVLIAGWYALPALFAAAFLCVDFGLSPAERAIVSAFLATGAPLAIMCASSLLKLKPTLENLTPSRLFVLSIASGLGNSVFYNFGLFVVGVPINPVQAHLVTFMGDVLGTWVILYAIKVTLHLWWRQRN